jgi:hypothetical protein
VDLVDLVGGELHLAGLRPVVVEAFLALLQEVFLQALMVTH